MKQKEQEKLKTLKDLTDPIFKRYTSGYVPSKAMKFQKDLIKELKAEAVKWVKECCRDDANNEILRCEGCNKMVVFFNITEEDLK